jgi:hypothetical protein
MRRVKAEDAYARISLQFSLSISWWSTPERNRVLFLMMASPTLSRPTALKLSLVKLLIILCIVFLYESDQPRQLRKPNEKSSSKQEEIQKSSSQETSNDTSSNVLTQCEL